METTPKQALAFVQDELDTALLYDALGAAERDARVAEVYRKLAATERRHADHWIEKLGAKGVKIPAHRVSWRTKVLIWMIKHIGARTVVSIVATQEVADAQRYSSVPDRTDSMVADEAAHARALRAIAGDGGGAEGPMIARLEGRHRSTAGNALRAAVLGANDGLLSNLSLVMGVAGAKLGPREIVITGIAGLLAGASSMALGEWLSVKNSRELYEKQIGVEAQEIEAHPEEEAEELTLIYQAKGLPEAQARQVASRLMKTEGAALDTLAREELGIDPHELGGSAIQAAVTSFILFAIGAIVPLAAFLITSGRPAVIASVIASGAGLFGIGAIITVLTGRSIWMSGFRQVAVGLGAAGITYLVGHLVGVGIS